MVAVGKFRGFRGGKLFFPFTLEFSLETPVIKGKLKREKHTDVY